MIRQHDGATPAGPTAVRDPEVAVLTRLQALSTQLDGEPDPRYRARTRARLVAMAAVRTPEPAGHPVRDHLLAARAVARPPSRWRGRVTAGLAGAAVGVTGLAALVAVAAGAAPGDPLYDLKRGTEQTQLALAGDSRGQTLLELAGTRLEELGALAEDGAAALFRSTLQTMDAQTIEGAALLTGHAVRTGDGGALATLTGWTAEQSTELDGLRGDIPQDAEPAYAGSAALLEALTARVTGLRTALQCPAGPATVGDDALGPVPGLCQTDAPPPVAGESPATTPAAPPTPDDPGSPGADPGTRELPSAPSRGPGRAPTGPGQNSGPTQGERPALGGDVLPPLADRPLADRSTTSTTTPSSPPVVAVPAPAPLSTCLPPPATVGTC